MEKLDELMHVDPLELRRILLEGIMEHSIQIAMKAGSDV